MLAAVQDRRSSPRDLEGNLRILRVGEEETVL